MEWALRYRSWLTPTNSMSPIDPVRPANPSPPPPMAPLATDDSLDLDEVEAGMEAAENDTRDAIIDLYETNARLSDDPEEELDDIDYTLSDGGEDVPELGAIHDDELVDDISGQDFEEE